MAHYRPVLQTSPSANSTTPADLSTGNKTICLSDRMAKGKCIVTVAPPSASSASSSSCAICRPCVVFRHTGTWVHHIALCGDDISCYTSVIAGAKYNQSMLRGDCALHEKGSWLNCCSRETLSYFRTFIWSCYPDGGSTDRLVRSIFRFPGIRHKLALTCPLHGAMCAHYWLTRSC